MRKISIFCYWFMCFCVTFLSPGNAQENCSGWGLKTQPIHVHVYKYDKSKIPPDVPQKEEEVTVYYLSDNWVKVKHYGQGIYKDTICQDKVYPIKIGGFINVGCPLSTSKPCSKNGTSYTGGGLLCTANALCEDREKVVLNSAPLTYTKLKGVIKKSSTSSTSEIVVIYYKK